jgi:hypothetical protein
VKLFTFTDNAGRVIAAGVGETEEEARADAVRDTLQAPARDEDRSAQVGRINVATSTMEEWTDEGLRALLRAVFKLEGA